MRRFKIILIIYMLAFPVFAFGYERIVVLYPAVSPILAELGVSGSVVGTTKNDEIFPNSTKVGTHLKPNIELINALKPDLIIAGSKMAFTKEMASGVTAEVFYYNPHTLKEILDIINLLGDKLGKKVSAAALVERLKKRLESVIKLKKRYSAIYEVMSEPLRVAGAEDIITSIIDAAGGVNAIDIPKKHVQLSIEKVLEVNPDVYIYQVGPMNKDPQPPMERYQYKGLKAKVIKVDELKFARPGIESFDAVVELNGILRGL